MNRNIHCTYISEKVNKIKWCPTGFGDPNSFLTGSWDNEVNAVRLWEIRPKSIDEESDINPTEITHFPFLGDVTELQFISPHQALVSSSLGSLYLLSVITNQTGKVDIVENTKWTNLHCYKTGHTSSCTSFAVYDNDVASVGEDGKINLVNTSSGEVTRTIDEADSCSLNCVVFLKYNELLTSNSRGQLKIWDLRSEENKPDNMFMLNKDNITAPTCMTIHPTQRHIIAAGDEVGSVTFWDLRKNTFPLNVVTSHMEAVSELLFHPDRPDHVFSCSVAGDVYHWSGVKHAGLTFDQEPWFTTPADPNKYDIFRLMPQLHVPVNSLDMNRDLLLCGCDNEAMYLIEDVNIYN